MHYVGRDMIYKAYYPNGTTGVLIDVDRYDYMWQAIYFYREPKCIPAGTRIEAIAHFDNSEACKELYKEINIDRAVGFGPATTDEMMIPYVSWTELEPGEGAEYRPSESTAGLGSD